MAKNAIRDYSTTAAANTDIGGIGVQGSNAVSNFDNAFRTIMAQLADMNAGNSPINDTFLLCDPADPTKRVRIDAGSITTASTRVITMPDNDIRLGNADDLTTGTVNDARLPSIMSQKQFSTQVIISGASPVLQLAETDTVKSWYVVADASNLDVREGTLGGAVRLSFTASGVMIDGAKAWTAGNDGTGSGLDADLLEGFHGDVNITASTYMRRDASSIGYAASMVCDNGSGIAFYYFNAAKTRYILYDGTTYYLHSAPLQVNGNIIADGSLFSGGSGGAEYASTGNIGFRGSMASAYGAALSVALDARAVVYTGTGVNDTAMPVGHTIAAAGNIDRNASTSVWLNSGNNLDYTTTASGAQLSGTYRGRGRHTVGSTQLERTA